MEVGAGFFFDGADLGGGVSVRGGFVDGEGRGR